MRWPLSCLVLAFVFLIVGCRSAPKKVSGNPSFSSVSVSQRQVVVTNTVEVYRPGSPAPVLPAKVAQPPSNQGVSTNPPPNQAPPVKSADKSGSPPAASSSTNTASIAAVAPNGTSPPGKNAGPIEPSRDSMHEQIAETTSSQGRKSVENRS